VSDAADKLVQTRLAIIAYVQRREHRSGGGAARHEGDAAGAEAEREQDLEDESHGRVHGWFHALKRAGRAWWRQHPAHAGLELATPVLSDYAARKPVAFLGMSALVGAALVVARPWRLISVTGLLVALLKSSQLSSMVVSAMSAANYRKDNRPPL
jgi:hypothetical protein